MNKTTSDLLMTALICIVLLVGGFGLVYLIVVNNHQSNVDKEILVRTCADDGGSWVVDGQDGECWQGVGRKW